MGGRSKNVGLRDLVGAGPKPTPVQLPSDRRSSGIAEAVLPRAPASTRGALGSTRRNAVASNTAPGHRRLDEARGKGLSTQLAVSYGGEVRRGVKMLAIAGGIAVLIVALLPVSGAVVISGSLIVGSNAKKIQHPVGGVIAQILVKDGDRVQSGMPLVRLHEVLAKTTLTTISRQADESAARIARLKAEHDGMETPQWPTQLAARAAEKDVAELIGSEVAQFDARARLRKRQAAVLQEHVVQLREQIVGLTAQLVSREVQAGHVAAELAGLEKLYAQALVPLPRISGVRREAARLEGEHHQLRSSITETRSKVTEAELQIVAQGEAQRAEVAKEISEHQSKQSELGDRQVAARDQYKRHEIIAPVTGVVTQLAVHTAGGVVGPGDVMMLVVPDSKDLIFEARLATKDIDQALVGQPATLRFPALNRASTPELRGAVSYVSADASRDPQTGGTYYTVRVEIAEHDLKRLDTSMHLHPGMPVEAFLETGSRSIASYLLKPFTDQLQRVLRER
jgi:HlyD family secretion protein